jgi:hypothetical protein
MANLGKRRARVLIQELKEIRRCSTMETANFAVFEKNEAEINDLIKSKTRLFRNTYLTNPLDRIIAELEKIYEVSNGR